MSDLPTLRPTEHRRVMDLVQEAGLDVSDWGNYAGGPTRAAANPKYCYEWAFVQPGTVVVLNVWYSDINDRHGVITLEDNLRASATNHARMHRPASPVWRKRASKFDEAVSKAAAERLLVRAIICDGRMRRLSEEHASKVKARMLDPVPWAVTLYDSKTGQFTLTRGAPPSRLVDQFVVGSIPDSPIETHSVTGKAFVRNPHVRQAALSRAAGRCEWCNCHGFTMPDGSVFLETHHIVPLGDCGLDRIQNVAALCPNHHREAHYGAAREVIREQLLRMAQNAKL